MSVVSLWVACSRSAYKAGASPDVVFHARSMQALRSEDRQLLERCLSVGDSAVITNSVERLQAPDATAFLQVCTPYRVTRPSCLEVGVAILSSTIVSRYSKQDQKIPVFLKHCMQKSYSKVTAANFVRPCVLSTVGEWTHNCHAKTLSDSLPQGLLPVDYLRLTLKSFVFALKVVSAVAVMLQACYTDGPCIASFCVDRLVS